MYLLLLITILLSAKSATTQSTAPDAYLMRLMESYGTTPDPVNCTCAYGVPLYLTPYINCDVSQAQCDALVDNTYFLPNIVSYSGYLTINEEYNTNLWFWYFPAANKPVGDAPLIFWIEGGPGASSLYGIFKIGPFYLGDDGCITENPYSWAQNQSLLMIDGPAGSGFSFTDCDDGYATTALEAGQQLYLALQQFYSLFPEVSNSPLILSGPFYGAKLAITVGYAIEQGNCNATTPINLQGLALFDGVIEVETQLYHSGFGLETALLDDASAARVEQLQNAGADAIGAGNLTDALYYYNSSFTIYFEYASLPNPNSFVLDNKPVPQVYLDFIQQPEIRSALHLGCTDLTILGRAYDELQLDIYSSARYWLEEVLYSYKVIFVNGVLSSFTPYYPSNYFYNSLDFDGACDFQNATRQFYTFNSTVVGYYRETTEVIALAIRNSGNLLGEEKPAQTLDIISSFSLNLTLSSTTSCT